MKAEAKPMLTRVHDVTGRYGSRVLILVYLLFALFFSSSIALRSWPDNPLRRRLYVAEAERLAALQVTSESVENVNRALATAGRLPAADESARPNRAELEQLVAHLPRDPEKSTPTIPANPLHWDRRSSSRASDLLRAERERLESRQLNLQPTSAKTGVWSFPKRVFLQTPDFDIDPALSTSERARVEILVLDMYSPRKVSEPTSAVVQSARPLLDKMQDTDFIVLVLALGAWGASAQSLASVAAYLGLRRYNDNWFVFYLTRPFLGATLALAFYIVLRGGLMTREATWTDINHVGYAAIAVLVGFFATEALENLKRVAKGFFADKEKSDGLEATLPLLRDVRWLQTASMDRLELEGSGFTTDSQVWVDDKLIREGVRFVDTCKIICDADVEKFKEGLPLKVLNPGDGAAQSKKLPIPPWPTAPVIEKVEFVPSGVELPATLKILGRRFATSVIVLMDGQINDRRLQAISSTAIEVDLAGPGTVVINPGTHVRVINQTGTRETSNEVKTS